MCSTGAVQLKTINPQPPRWAAAVLFLGFESALCGQSTISPSWCFYPFVLGDFLYRKPSFPGPHLNIRSKQPAENNHVCQALFGMLAEGFFVVILAECGYPSCCLYDGLMCRLTNKSKWMNLLTNANITCTQCVYVMDWKLLRVLECFLIYGRSNYASPVHPKNMGESAQVIRKNNETGSQGNESLHQKV